MFSLSTQAALSGGKNYMAWKMSDIFQAPAWKISGIFRATECPNFLPHGTPTRIYSHSAHRCPPKWPRRSDHREQVTGSDRPSDRKWPPEASDRKWPPGASDRKWPQVTAQVTTYRAKWPQVTAAVTASDRPSDRKWPPEASDRKWPPGASDRKWPPKWPPIEPSDRKWPPQWPPRVSDRKWPPKWPQVTARGKWPQVTAGSKWPQVTASDWFSKNQFLLHLHALWNIGLILQFLLLGSSFC